MPRGKGTSPLVSIVLLAASALANVCTTPGCRKASSDVLSFIDPSVDPCDDFYGFVCSGIFRKTHNAKPASLEEILKKELDDQTTMMLIKPIHPAEPKAIQGLKRLFRSCMDEAAIEKYGYSSIRRALKLIGGWPVVEGSKWKEEDFTIEELLVKLRRMGYNFMPLFSIRTTAGGNQTYMISEPTIQDVESKDKENYHDYMIDTALLLGADKHRASLELQETLLFKMKLLRIVEKQDLYNKSSIKAIENIFPGLNWKQLINNIIYPNEEIDEDDEIYFSSTDYFDNLQDLLEDTPNRIIANYIIWEALTAVTPYLPKAFRDLQRRYVSSAADITVAEDEDKPRMVFCKNRARESLRPAFEVLYVREYFSPAKRQETHSMVSIIRDELMDLLNETELYDEETRSAMLGKAEELKFVIGAPERLFDQQMLSELVEEKENVNSNDFLTIASTLKRQATNQDLKLEAETDFYSSYFDEETILEKVFYTTHYNTLVLPAAVLQGLYFNEDRPRYMNFGTIGVVLATELIHGFTLEGGNYNSGPYRSHLFSEAAENNFYKQSECLVQLVEKFHIEHASLQMNGSQVLDETVCDIAGVELAYRAYESWVNITGEERQLPGLDYTPRQLFWISAGSTFCETVSLDRLKDYIEGEKVAHPTFRMFGALSNNEHFGKDFRCRFSSRMNPTEKCEVF